MKGNKGFLAVFCLVVLLIFGCSKKENEEEAVPETVDTQATKDNDQSQKEWDNIFDLTKNAMTVNDNNVDKAGFTICGDTNLWCAIVCLDTAYTNVALDPNIKGRMVIDFDSVSGCNSVDGRTRSGKIYVDYTGKYRTQGTKIYTSLDNFYVDGIKVEGEKIVENIGNDTFNVQVNNAKMIFTDGTSTTWESSRTRAWIAGQSTPLNLLDDEYQINGSASGVNRNGISFTAAINQVQVKLACWLSPPYTFIPSKGTITISPSGFQDRILDYGDGTCDKDVTITIGDKTYSISL